MSDREKRLRDSRADRHSFAPPDPGDKAIQELPAYVYIGAAVRYTRRSVRSMNLEHAILAGLRRHASEGNNAAAIVADWLQRKLAAPLGRTTAPLPVAIDRDPLHTRILAQYSQDLLHDL